MEIKVRKGDIVLWGSNQDTDSSLTWIYKIQGKFDGEARHAEIITDAHKDMVKTLGSNFDDVKYRSHIISKPYVCIIRPNIDISNIAERVARDLYNEILRGDHKSYDFCGLANASVNAFLYKLTNGKWKKKLLFSSSKDYYCSELATEFLKRAFKEKGEVLEITDKYNRPIPTSVVSPTDLYKFAKSSKLFTVIKDFEK